jgi:hypothetical protein
MSGAVRGRHVPRAGCSAWRNRAGELMPVSSGKLTRQAAIMRYTTLILAVVLLLPGCGRLVKVSDQDQMIRQIFTVELHRNDIYDRSLEWCARKLASVNDDIVVKDREKGRIIGKGTGKYSEYFDFLVDRQFSYTITIDIKEGRYRVTFDNFVVYYDERQIKASKAEFKFEIGKIRKQIDKLMEELRDYVSKGTTEKEKETIKKEEEW